MNSCSLRYKHSLKLLIWPQSNFLKGFMFVLLKRNLICVYNVLPKMFHRYEALGKMLSKTLIKIYVAVAHSGKYVLRYMSVQLLHVKTGGAL